MLFALHHWIQYDPIIPFSCSHGKSLGWTKITTRVRVCTGSGGKTSPAAINAGMWSNILMQLDKLCTSSILMYFEIFWVKIQQLGQQWAQKSMLVNRYESLLNYFAALQLQLFFVLCEQVTKTKLGWALTAFTTSLSYCLLEGETVHGWFVATQITLMYPYVSLCHIILSQRHEHDLPFVFTSMICVCLQAWDALPIGFKVRPEKTKFGRQLRSQVAMSLCHGQLLNYMTAMVWILQKDTKIFIYIYLAERSNLPQSRSIFFFSIFRDNKR